MRSARRWYWFWTSPQRALACSSSVGIVLYPHSASERLTSTAAKTECQEFLLIVTVSSLRIEVAARISAGVFAPADERTSVSPGAARPSRVRGSRFFDWHNHLSDRPKR